MTPPTHCEFAQSLIAAAAVEKPCHSEERSDVGISRYCVRIHTLFQKIAAPLRARNDMETSDWFFCFAWTVIRADRANKKSPEPSGSRDESLIRGTTLLAACAAPSGSSKPYPGNGGNRVPLLRLRARLQDRLRNQTSGAPAPARTIRRLSAALEQGGFFLRCLCDVYI